MTPTRQDPEHSDGAVVVYTDGACSGNPGPGGWGWATLDGRRASGSENPSTNQRMEIYAALDAAQTLLADDVRLTVVSDSTYVVNCFRDNWWRGWLSRGWKNSQKQPVANQDLWKPLIEIVRSNLDRIEFRWVKGHSGHPMNDLVDALAVAAAQSQSGRVELGSPTANRAQPNAESRAQQPAVTRTAVPDVTPGSTGAAEEAPAVQTLF